MSYIYDMDIRQSITKFENVQTEGMDLEALRAFIAEINDEETEIRKFIDQLSRIRSRAQEKVWDLNKQKELALNQQAQERMAGSGFKPGAIFYIDRHDGVYIVEWVDQYHVSFRRFMDGRDRGKSILMSIDRIDRRLTPLRTEGPFKIGDSVIRYGYEFRVEGYLGFRMLLSREIGSRRQYSIVKKKDEAIYRQIII